MQYVSRFRHLAMLETSSTCYPVLVAYMSCLTTGGFCLKTILKIFSKILRMISSWARVSLLCFCHFPQRYLLHLDVPRSLGTLSKDLHIAKVSSNSKWCIHYTRPLTMLRGFDSRPLWYLGLLRIPSLFALSLDINDRNAMSNSVSTGNSPSTFDLDLNLTWPGHNLSATYPDTLVADNGTTLTYTPWPP